MEEVVKDFGRIDVFVANAGMAISKPILEQTVEEYRTQMSVNGRSTPPATNVATRRECSIMLM